MVPPTVWLWTSEEMRKRNLPATLFDSSQGAASQPQPPSQELLLGDVSAVPRGAHSPRGPALSLYSCDVEMSTSDWQAHDT